MTISLAVELNQVSFTWPKQATPTLVIEHLSIPTQKHVFIQGPSGCGKSSLLSLLTGIIQPQAGAVRIHNCALNSLSQSKRDQFRAQHIGYIFQQFNLLPYLSVIENVLLPCRFSPVRKLKAHKQDLSLEDQAKQLLTRLNLPEYCFKTPINELSIGQQQRVAAARALIGQPELIIADEPTSALDQDNRQAFIELLIEEANRSNATVLFVSHDSTLRPYFDLHIDLPEINQASHDNQQGEIS